MCTFMYLPYLTFYNIVSCLLSIFLLFFFYLLIYLPDLLTFLLFQCKMMYPSFLFCYTYPLILIFNSLCITSKRIFGRVNKHQHSTHSRCTSTYLLVKKHIWNRTDLGLEFQTSFSLFQFYNSILLCEIFFFSFTLFFFVVFIFIINFSYV